MNKYKCFDEFCGKELYGKDLADALMHVGELPRPALVTGTGGLNSRIPQPPVIVMEVLGYEDTSQCRRGGKQYLSAIIETAEGSRLSVDVLEAGTLREVGVAFAEVVA